MKKIYTLLILSISLFTACTDGAHNTGACSDAMVQVETFDYFASGHYKGIYPLADLLKETDFGIGTVDGLDGEMYMRGGETSQILASGEIIRTPDDAMLPFAMLCRFVSDTVFTYTSSEGISVFDKINQVMNNPDLLLAVELKGRFSSMTTRSVPKQEEPYKTVQEIVATEQVTFDCGETEGAAVGYRIPARFAAVNPEGYHIHYISTDRMKGGHVLAFEPENISVSIQVLDTISVKRP